MAEEKGIESPPYPGRGATVKSMYRYLELLREWTVAELFALTEIVPQVANQLNSPEELSPLSVWEAVSLADQFSAYMYVRRVREAWDYTLREHEDSWDGQVAFQKRAGIIGLATELLNNCFVNSEQREMREDVHAQHMRGRLRSMQQILARTFAPPGMFAGPGDGELDWDAMFQEDTQDNSDGP